MKLLFLLYVNYIRPVTSWFFYSIFKITFIKEGGLDDMFELPIENFNRIMKNLSYRYKIDPLCGLIDYTIKDPNYFFSFKNEFNILYGRDCDDFAHAWLQYAKENEIPASKIYVMDKFKPWKAHVFTVMYIGNKITVCDYDLGPCLDDMEDVIFHIRKVYKYKNIIWCYGETYGP